MQGYCYRRKCIQELQEVKRFQERTLDHRQDAFKGCKKLKTITLANKKVTIKKGAFAGLNTKKITVKAPKMSKKELKKFKKALKKAGFKGKVK
ncbi:MAG: leucine-rich repeat protein [Clostridium sp.]